MTNPGITMELPIPGSGRRGGQGRADLYRAATGEIWEIKPKSANGREEGLAQLGRYLDNCPSCKAGAPFANTVRTIDPINPTQDLYYSSYDKEGVLQPGMIFYAPKINHRRRVLDVAIEPNSVPVPPWVYGAWAAWYAAKALNQGGGGIQPGLQPAFQ
jgi:hypothetical protein